MKIKFEQFREQLLSKQEVKGSSPTLGLCDIVVKDFDCYTGNHSLIPTHSDSLGK